MEGNGRIKIVFTLCPCQYSSKRYPIKWSGVGALPSSHPPGAAWTDLGSPEIVWPKMQLIRLHLLWQPLVLGDHTDCTFGELLGGHHSFLSG